MIGILGKEALTKFAIHLAKDILLQLVTNTTSCVIDNFKRKMRGCSIGARDVKLGEASSLLILNQGMDNIVRMTKCKENSGLFFMVLLKQ